MTSAYENEEVLIILLFTLTSFFCFLNMLFILIPALKFKTLPAVCADLVKPCMASNIQGCVQRLWWGVQRWIFYWFCDEKKPGLFFISHFFPAWDPAWWQQHYCKLNITDASINAVINTRWFPNSSSKLSRKGTIIIYLSHPSNSMFDQANII